MYNICYTVYTVSFKHDVDDMILLSFLTKGAQTLQGHISCEKSLIEKATATQTKTEKPRWTIRSLSTTTGCILILQ